MPTSTLDRPTAPLPGIWGVDTPSEPVKVQNGSILFRPSDMEIGHYYCVELDGKPYLYRKINDTEVEVYGLAD